MAFNWQGAWNSGTAYALGDAVYYGGNSYISIQAGTNNIPSSAPTFWSILALQGAVGATGSQGYTTDASLLVAGTLADSRLSGNVALLNGTNTFTGTNIQRDIDKLETTLITQNAKVWTYIFAGQTTNATATELLCNTGRLTIAATQHMPFVMQGGCVQTSGTPTVTNNASFKAEGSISRITGGNATVTGGTAAAMTGSNTLVTASTAVTLTADTTNQSLKVTVTGLASTTIEWCVAITVTTIS